MKYVEKDKALRNNHELKDRGRNRFVDKSNRVDRKYAPMKRNDTQTQENMDNSSILR